MEENPFSSRPLGGSHGGSRFVFSWKASLVYGWVAFLVLLCLFVVWHKVTNQDAQLTKQTNETIDAEEITIDDLQSVNDGLAASTKGRSLEVNGTLKVNDALIFDPSDPPDNPVRGQVYFDDTANVPMYYDGQRFVAVVSSANADDRTVTVQPAEVRTTVIVSSGSSADTVTSTTNTNGNLARFGAGNTLIDSLLSESGSSVNVAGNLNLGGNALQLGGGGFGLALNTTTLSANQSISLPDASGTICLQGASSCGFVAGTAADFIRNQNAVAQVSTNYWVSGTGRADGGLLGPSLDTTDGGVLSLGGNAGAVAVNGNLQVSVNNSSVTTPSLLLGQAGTGDTTIELQNSIGNSFYLGIDQSSGGSLRIGSTTNALTTNPVGILGAGGSQFQGVENQIIARKVVTGPVDSGNLSSIAVHLGSVDVAMGGVKVAVYAHDAANNRPGTLVAATTTGMAGTVGWNAIPVSAPISPNTTYWVAVNVEGSGTGVSWDYCGGCGVDSTTTYPRPYGGAWPDPHGVPNNALDTYIWSIYMNVASGTVTDTYAGAKLFSMTDLGSITLQNSMDTSSALLVQNASGTELMRADTNGMKLIVRELDVTYNLSVGGNVTFQGHLQSGGAAPVMAAGAAACTSPTVTIDGTDTAGMLTVTAGTGCASSGTIATITFDNVFANAPNVSLTPATSTAASLPTYVDHTLVTSSSFAVASSTQLTDATTYRWYYQVIE